MSANLMLTRRHVLGGLVIAIALPGCKQSRNSSGKSSTLEPNAWLRIGSDDSITFFCDRAGDRELRITAEGRGSYVKSVTLDGVPVDVPALTHTQLANASTLVFVMSDKPTNWGRR